MAESAPSPPAFWSSPVATLNTALGTTGTGLSQTEASARLARFGPNTLAVKSDHHFGAMLWRQFSSPLVGILLGAALLAFAVGDHSDGLIILTIVSFSAILGFWQERGAASAVQALLAMVALTVEVQRDGITRSVPLTEVVPGDLVLLAAGAAIPADCRLLAASDLFVDEATLTGETFPVEKMPGDLAAATPLSQRTNSLFLGTHVVSGTGQALVVHTAANTAFGAIAGRLRLRPEETDFERGVRRFGGLLMQVVLLMLVVIFAVNVWLQRPVLDSFLFALALAVGLTPELLPAIININLATGARRMAAKRVIVKRLAAIENFGSMDVLCTDKTGTLTEGTVQLAGALDVQAVESPRVRRLAAVNAHCQTGFINPIDKAIRVAVPALEIGVLRLDEVPYDFIRKRLSVLARVDDTPLLISKGALAQILAVSTEVETAPGVRAPIAGHRAAIDQHFAECSARGLRVLGLAVRAMPGATGISRADETGLCLVGFLLFADPPKRGLAATLTRLAKLGVALKIITGDNPLVARDVARQIGLGEVSVMTGTELRGLSDDALPRRAVATQVFAEIEPNQKERLILALRKAGHVVGYLGDGINDAPALHAADVGVSVAEAVAVAREAADIVLLERDLEVLIDGICEGRRTFANTLKYVFMATSANFGNMFSMAGASLLLPFLPLLPKQILLNNLLTDLPEMAIASDAVDADWIDRPRRWDVRFIRDFMVCFGLLSSVFDFLTFGSLLSLHATPALFRSGWFVESVVSATLIVLVVRTHSPFLQSRPSGYLAGAVVLVVAATVALPYTPLGAVFGFVPLPGHFLLVMAAIVLAYLLAAEWLKRVFYRRHQHASAAASGVA